MSERISVPQWIWWRVFHGWACPACHRRHGNHPYLCPNRPGPGAGYF